MTLPEFERRRADISHCLLRNGIFLRLGANPSVAEADDTVEVRARKLAVSSVAVSTEKGNFRKAAATWLEGDGGLRSVKEEVLNLIEAARELPGIVPGERFPDTKEIKERIERCDTKMHNVENLFAMESREQQEWFTQFWRDALVVNDVVHSFCIRMSKHFWGVFRSATT